MITKIKRKTGFTYCARIFLNGRRISKTFKRKENAESWERRLLHDRDSGRVGLERLDDKLSLLTFSERWLRDKVEARLSPATAASYRSDLKNHILPKFGNLKLSEIQQTHGNRLIADLRQAGLASKTINDMLGMLKGMLKDAVKWRCIGKSGLEGLQGLKEIPKPEAYWTEREIDQFVSAAQSNPLLPVFVFALNTGMRRGEICGLKWDRVNLDQNTISVSRSLGRYGLSETTKNGKHRSIPMNDVVKDLLVSLHEQRKGEYIFCKEDGSPLDAQHLYRDFQAAQKLCVGVPKIRFHDLRHTYASNFMMNGGNLFDLQKLLGHSTSEMTERYAHLSPSHLAKAAQVVNFGRQWQQVATPKLKLLESREDSIA